jgi:hypothetical protein
MRVLSPCGLNTLCLVLLLLLSLSTTAATSAALQVEDALKLGALEFAVHAVLRVGADVGLHQVSVSWQHL